MTNRVLMPSHLDEAFITWLISRRIVQKQEKSYLCFDTRVFAANGSAVMAKDVKAKKYVYDYQENATEFPRQTVENIERYLQELKHFSFKNPHLDGCEQTYPSDLQKSKSSIEPVWSDPHFTSPGIKLLPINERLSVNNLPKTDEAFVMPYAHYSPSFKNNLMCVYGRWIFMADKHIIEVHNSDCLLVDQSQWREVKFLISLRFCKNYVKFHSNSRFSENIIEELFQEANLRVNFLHVCKFVGRDVLCVCVDGGMLIMYDIFSILSACQQHAKGRKKADNRIFVKPMPFHIIRTPESCWSVDTFDEGAITYVAVGHNGPGVSVFAFKMHQSDDSDSLQALHSTELPSVHNVPCVNFVPDSIDQEGFVTLAFCSVYGNVTTIKLRLNVKDNTIQARTLDTQFFGSFCWTITPLHKRDFRNVAEFEYLNMNYQTNFKKSIIYSVIQDSFILGCHPPNVYCSGEFGIGALTTQIPVPVAPLEWRCQNGMMQPVVKLRFTAFNEEGTVSQAHLKHSDSSNMIPGYGPILMLNRMVNESIADRVILDMPEDRIGHYYMFQKNSRQCDRFTDEERKRYENWWNSKNCIGPKNNSIRPSYDVWTSELKHGGREVADRHLLKDVSSFSLRNCNVSTNERVSISNSSFFNGAVAISPTNLCGYSLVEAFHELDRSEPVLVTQNDREASMCLHHNYFSPDTLLNSGHIGEQEKWAIHNHARKTRHLLNLVEPDSKCSPVGYRLPDLDSDFFFVTTAHHLYLVKAHPLLVTSFTQEKIFPMTNVTVCCNHQLLIALDRINFVCHIKELNCIVVASQVGLISLLRLTEYNGIYSFRQEFLLGWQSQNPDAPNTEAQCILSDVEPGSNCQYCGIDDVRLPYYYIVGMDYSYVPYDEANDRKPYAILYVLSRNTLHRFKIN